MRNLQHVQRKDIETITSLLRDFRCEGCSGNKSAKDKVTVGKEEARERTSHEQGQESQGQVRLPQHTPLLHRTPSQQILYRSAITQMVEKEEEEEAPQRSLLSFAPSESYERPSRRSEPFPGNLLWAVACVA